jgi:multiple sugar transport system permease protein
MKPKLGVVLAHIALLAGAAASLFPFVWMLLLSLKPYGESLSTQFLPQVWTLDNYARILSRMGFVRAFLNSTVIVIPATLMTVVTSTAAGYVFSKYRFKGKEAIFTAILATMMVPFAAVIIPLFITMKDLGLVNKVTGIIITSLCSTFGIFLMRQAVESIPNDYIEAARIDGASELWILIRVIMPLVRPVMATLAVFTFLGNWDSYMWPSILLRSPDTKTLPVLVAGMHSLLGVRYTVWAAGSMLTVAPVMVLFAFAQKQFIKGLAITGLKG